MPRQAGPCRSCRTLDLTVGSLKGRLKSMNQPPLPGTKPSQRISMRTKPKKEQKAPQTIIAVLALLVSIGSASFSYVQSRNSAAQLRLAEQQLRPHVVYSPVFFRTKQGLDVDLYLLNQSALPARVHYTDVAGWIAGEFVSPTFHSTGEDIIYQEKGGSSSLPTLKGKPLARIEKGDALVLATCVLYSSNTDTDSRRWKLQAVHEYVRGSRFPSRTVVGESLVPASQRECSARDFGRAQGVEIQNTATTSRSETRR